MPVTFSIPITTCDGTNRPLRIGDSNWPLVGLDVAQADTSGQYESIVPLCKNGPGGVGWLDMKCGAANLAAAITTLATDHSTSRPGCRLEPGNANNVEGALNNYAGQVILVPMFDSTCRDVPSTGLPADCTDPGSGNNLYYHIPRFATFLLDEAYVTGNNHPECNSSARVSPSWATAATAMGARAASRAGSCAGSCRARSATSTTAVRAGGSSDCLHEPILGVQLVR